MHRSAYERQRSGTISCTHVCVPESHTASTHTPPAGQLLPAQRNAAWVSLPGELRGSGAGPCTARGNRHQTCCLHPQLLPGGHVSSTLIAPYPTGWAGWPSLCAQRRGAACMLGGPGRKQWVCLAFSPHPAPVLTAVASTRGRASGLPVPPHPHPAPLRTGPLPPTEARVEGHLRRLTARVPAPAFPTWVLQVSFHQAWIAHF